MVNKLYVRSLLVHGTSPTRNTLNGAFYLRTLALHLPFEGSPKEECPCHIRQGDFQLGGTKTERKYPLKYSPTVKVQTMRKLLCTTLAATGLAMLASLGNSQPSHSSALGMISPWSFLKPAPKQEPVQAKKNLEAFANHDVVVLLDKSGSMETEDCPSSTASESQSRWDWCREQTQDLSAQTKHVLKDGIRVVVFSTMQTIYDNVKLRNIPSIFAANKPKGSTNIGIALKRQLDDYFRRRSRPEEGAIKPLLIAVVSDGCYEHSIPIQRVITDATNRMESRDEVSIVFLQVGQDRDAANVLNNLARGNSPVGRKAAFDIVSAKPFAAVQKEGLTNALLELVSSNTSTYQ